MFISFDTMKILDKRGNEALMQRTKTAFICSRKTPDGLEYLVGKWLLGLTPEADCIMCGNQSPMERAVFTTLLQRKIPVILALAEAMPGSFGADINEALGEGRLLVVTHCEPSVHSVTARSAFDRNILMLSMAQKIVVGYCTKGGNLERALAGFDNVEYLENGQPWLKMPGEARPETPAAAVHRPEPEAVQARWSRSLKANGGTVFLDFVGNGAENYLKITHSKSIGDGKYSRETLYFDRKELSCFSRMLAVVAERTGKGEPMTPELTVSSLSGDVSFSAVREGSGGVIGITQVKNYTDGNCRLQTVTLRPAELTALISGVNDALAAWKG